MSRLGQIFRWVLRKGLRAGASAVVQEIQQDRSNPGNKAKKAGLRLVEKDK